MANAIVLEVLEFVRPIRLQVEHISLVGRHPRRDGAGREPRAARRRRRSRSSCRRICAAIQGDPHQLRQLFTNLLTNAFEALERTRLGAHRRHAAARRRGARRRRSAAAPMVQVDVTDDGPGVPPDVMDRIFSPFFTTKPQGSGLGLAIVRKIVDAHDGRIDVSARARGGTQFRVTLPVTGNHQLFG